MFDTRAKKGFGHGAADNDFLDGAVGADEVRAGERTEFVEAGSFAYGVKEDGEGEAELRGKGERGGFAILRGGVDGEEDETGVLISFVNTLEGGHFGAAWAAPTRPEVDDDGVAAQRGKGDGVAVRGGQGKVRGEETRAGGGDFSTGSRSGGGGREGDPECPRKEDQKGSKAEGGEVFRHGASLRRRRQGVKKGKRESINFLVRI